MRKLLLALAFVVLPIATKAATIPFVGCPTDVPGGGQVTPTGQPMKVDMPADIAAKLALYGGAHEAVLAPRGWKCSGILGNDAELLRIDPPAATLHVNNPSIFVGSWGGGSGFQTAMHIAGQYFPNLVSTAELQNFVEDWNGYGVTVAQILAPRYPTDRLTYLGPSALEYETPPRKDGLERLVFGATSLFAQYGIISLHLIKDGSNYDPDGSHINFITVSLPYDFAYLTPYILRASRPCILNGNIVSCTMYDGITYPDQ